MECYFGETPGKETGNPQNNRMRHSKMVLKDELWKGQEHGSMTENIAHSRYLRCLCENFSTGEAYY